MALEIIQQGEVRPLTQAKINGKLRRGLSLTRSIGFASIYNDVVFGFNANRIRHHLRARLVPHADPEMGVSDEFHADHRREAEEFLIGMLPLNGYLVALWLTDANTYTIEPEERAQLMAHPHYAGLLSSQTLWKA